MKSYQVILSVVYVIEAEDEIEAEDSAIHLLEEDIKEMGMSVFGTNIDEL